jgi:hypothetical protein
LEFHRSYIAEEVARPLSDVFAGKVDDIKLTNENIIDFSGPTKQLDIGTSISEMRRGDSFKSYYETKHGVRLDNESVKHK